MTIAAAASPVAGLPAALAIVIPLLVAAYSGFAAFRQWVPDRVQMIGLAVVQVSLLVLTAVALIAISGGERPGEAATFAGYLVTAVCLPALAAVLAKMEPTRWGSAIVCVICLTIPVLIVRLQQTWEVAGG
ncbi:hypothetical protein [Melissospora conviva]|uniref:hypothetical protein n=1 Tax=Melissospora conviva TaxID=3388432 RepID=UPI003B7938B8